MTRRSWGRARAAHEERYMLCTHGSVGKKPAFSAASGKRLKCCTGEPSHMPSVAAVCLSMRRSSFGRSMSLASSPNGAWT